VSAFAWHRDAAGAGSARAETMTAPTAESRGRARSRRALFTSAANLAARLITIATSFATIPLTLHYLGAERFGLWMTISSLTALLAFADFGLGNGLLNALAEANGRDDVPAMRRAIASATLMLGTLGLALLALLVPTILVFDWVALFGLKEALAVQELKPALLVFAACFVLNILAGIVQRTQLGLQMGFVNGIANAAGSLLGLLGVLLAIQAGAGLPWLIAALLGGPLVAAAAGGLWLFARRRELIPRRSDAQHDVMRRLLSLGGLFLVLQVSAALAYSSDNLIGAHFIGAAAVGDYAIAAKLFNIVAIVVPILLGPLWPAYGEALARGDIAWARRTLWRSTLGGGTLALVMSLGLLWAFGAITELWLQRQPAVSMPLLWGLAAWMVVTAFGGGIAMFLNGAHVVAEQAVVAVLLAASCVVGKVLAVQQFGLAALPWVTALSYLGLVLIPYLVLLPRILRRLNRRSDGAAIGGQREPA